jgi:hypothetical protein
MGQAGWRRRDILSDEAPMGRAPATRVGLKCGRGRGKASRRLAMPSLLWQEAERFDPRPDAAVAQW